MLTVHSGHHALQDGQVELVDGRLVPCFETPRRAFLIRNRIQEVGLGAILPPDRFGRAPLGISPSTAPASLGSGCQSYS